MSERQRTILFGPMPPPYGGVSVFMSSLYRAVQRLGTEVWSYTGHPEELARRDVRRVDHRRLQHVPLILRRARKARVTDSTHFHLEYPHWLLTPVWLALKKRQGFHWIKIVHDGSLPARYPRFSVSQKKRFARSLAAVDELVVYSRDLEDWFRREMKHSGTVRFMPLLTPQVASEPTPMSPEHRGALDQYGRHQQRVCCVGAFIPSYGFHHVAEAVEQLRSEGSADIGLLLADGAFARDDAFRSSVVKGRKWIHTASGLPQPAVRLAMADSDAFVRAFEHESYGLSRVEAILAGTPVIATDVGETRGMLTYDFGDIPALKQHLRSILEDAHDPETSKWAEVYEREAQQNLREYVSLITGVVDAA